MATLRMGIVGSRLAAYLHLLAYRRVRGIEARLVGVTSPTADRREAFAHASGATAYPSLAAIRTSTSSTFALRPRRTTR